MAVAADGTATMHIAEPIFPTDLSGSISGSGSAEFHFTAGGGPHPPGVATILRGSVSIDPNNRLMGQLTVTEDGVPVYYVIISLTRQ